MSRDDKTVFGQPFPKPKAGQDDSVAADETVFGTPLPEDQTQRPIPPKPEEDDGKTVFGGALPGFKPSRPAPQRRVAPTERDIPIQGKDDVDWYNEAIAPRRDIYDADTGRRTANEALFPATSSRQPPETPHVRPTIPLESALQATGLGQGGSSNPLVALAANLLILLGRLRTGLVEMKSVPLLDHVAREIEAFERNALNSGVSAADVQEAKYALAATGDDVVQNLPGVDRGMWIDYSMGARFFNDRNAGVGFYQRLDDAMKAPGQKFQLLELMLACLNLGFVGQYRMTENGENQLARTRTAVYDTLRRVTPRPDDDVSVRWMPVVLQGKRRLSGPPVWVVGAGCLALVVATFALLSSLLSREAVPAVERISLVHAGLPILAMEADQPIVREPIVPPPEIVVTQLERLNRLLAEQIAAQQVMLEPKGEWIVVRVGQVLQFDSGRATLKPGFEPVAQKIAAAVETETGPIRVLGHADGTPMSGRGQFKTNLTLSEARAQTVADILAETLSDPARLQVEGKGFTQPLVSPETSKDDKARNRRVEVLIRKEQ
jgi:type VI secretion system protein ImpK